MPAASAADATRAAPPVSPTLAWGPQTWAVLHSFSFLYPERADGDERLRMLTFLHGVAEVLPCPRCRVHFAAHLRRYAPSAEAEVLTGREALSRFLVRTHNEVNRRLGKPEWTYEQALAAYAPRAPGVCPTTAPGAPAGPPEHLPRASSPLPLLVLFVGIALAVLVVTSVSRPRESWNRCAGASHPA